MKVVVMEKNHEDCSCWVTDVKYPKIDNKYIHRQFAAGVGKVGRHLCSINHCINPMHLVMGSDADNAEDEGFKQYMLKRLLLEEDKASNFIVYKIGVKDVEYANFKMLVPWYAIWKKFDTGKIWEYEVVVGYFERLWKLRFRLGVERRLTREELGEDIYNEQVENRFTLKILLKDKRIPTVSVEG